MRAGRALSVFASVLLFSVAASAGGLELRRPMICATLRAMTCEAEADCKVAPIEEINAPRFMRIDVAGRTILSDRPTGADRTTAIEVTRTGDERLMLLGFENGLEGEVAWNLVVGRQTGKMTLSVAAEDVGFVVFGACTSLTAEAPQASGSSRAPASDRAELAVRLAEFRAEHDAVVFKLLRLGPQEESQFKPLYAEYRQRMIDANDQALALLLDYAANYQTLTDEQARAMSDRFIAYEEQKQNVKNELLPKIRDVIPPKTFARFVQVENKIDAASSFTISRGVPLVEGNPAAPVK
jgi:hypothetical protein